jgi:hypothetical protein
VIEKVESIRLNLQRGALGNFELLVNSEVDIGEARTRQRRNTSESSRAFQARPKRILESAVWLAFHNFKLESQFLATTNIA